MKKEKKLFKWQIEYKEKIHFTKNADLIDTVCYLAMCHEQWDSRDEWKYKFAKERLKERTCHGTTK